MILMLQQEVSDLKQILIANLQRSNHVRDSPESQHQLVSKTMAAKKPGSKGVKKRSKSRASSSKRRDGSAEAATQISKYSH